MESFEQMAIDNVERKPMCLKYADDTFIIWKWCWKPSYIYVSS